MTKSTVAYESQIMTALKLIPPWSCFPCPPSELADRQWRGGGGGGDGGGGDGGQDGGDGGRRAVWDQDGGDLEIITSVYFLINAIPFIFISVFFGHSTQCQSSFRIPDRCSTMKYLPLLVSNTFNLSIVPESAVKTGQKMIYVVTRILSSRTD